MGFATANSLAEMGAKVVLAVRDPTKGNEAAAKIKGSVEVFACDLGDLASVKAFAKRWGDRPVDVLMLNAGVMAIPERSLTKDGFERHYAVNHLGHFALTALLWPSVRKAADLEVGALEVGEMEVSVVEVGIAKVCAMQIGP